MAIKGLAYTKTSWAFEERPVASSKLNSWDDRIEAALELAFYLLAHAWGGGDGVLRGVLQELRVVAQATPDLTVRVLPGCAFIGRFPARLATSTQTPAAVPPVAALRIDLVQFHLSTWNVSLKQGQESAAPVAPSPDTDCITLATLQLRPGMTCIRDIDDGMNAFILDTRTFV